MAGWAELLEARLLSTPKRVFLCTGEISSLVWDKILEALAGYDFYVRVEKDTDIGYSLSGYGANTAYLLVDPSNEVLKAAEALVRSGGTDAIYILISGEPDKYDKGIYEYLKKKAQQSKGYYTVTVPKAEQARNKMVSHFLMRWGVARDTSQRVCAALEYSPGQIYLFDKQFLLCTGGQVLPSSHTQGLVTELLGQDSPNMVVNRIFSRTPVDLQFGEDFTYRVLKFLHTLVTHARVIHGAWSTGATSLAEVSKSTGLTQFLVLRAWGIAENYDPKALRKCEDLVLFGMENTGNPDLLSVISRVWGR